MKVRTLIDPIKIFDGLARGILEERNSYEALMDLFENSPNKLHSKEINFADQEYELSHPVLAIRINSVDTELDEETNAILAALYEKYIKSNAKAEFKIPKGVHEVELIYPPGSGKIIKCIVHLEKPIYRRRCYSNNPDKQERKRNQYRFFGVLSKIGGGSCSSTEKIFQHELVDQEVRVINKNPYMMKRIPYSESDIPKDELDLESRITLSISNNKITELHAKPIIYFEDDFGIIVMRILPGKDLGKTQQEIDADKLDKLSEDEFISISLKLLNDLKKIHGLKLIHGDIKPANIMVNHQNKISRGASLNLDEIEVEHSNNDDESIEAGFIDFGASRPFGSDKHLTDGTPRYQAPEIGKTHPDYRIDIYSFGKVLEDLWDKYVVEDKMSEEGRNKILLMLQSMQDENVDKRPSLDRVIQLFKYQQYKLHTQNNDAGEGKLSLDSLFDHLSRYIKDREEERNISKKQYKTFFGRILGYSADVKISAASKMINIVLSLQRNTRIDNNDIFTDDELNALRDFNLGRIITSHQALLPNWICAAEKQMKLKYLNTYGRR